MSDYRQTWMHLAGLQLISLFCYWDQLQKILLFFPTTKKSINNNNKLSIKMLVKSCRAYRTC